MLDRQAYAQVADVKPVQGNVRSIRLPQRQPRTSLEEATCCRMRERPGQVGRSLRLPEVEADSGFEGVHTQVQRGIRPDGQDRPRPFENAETLDQLASGTKQARPLDEREQFEGRSDLLATANSLFDQTLGLVQLVRLEAEGAEGENRVTETDMVFDASSTGCFERCVRGLPLTHGARRARRGHRT